jgi:Flp pilus assembly protein TadD
MEPDTTPEDHRQRALLLADLGRYDEAADEIAAGLTATTAASGPSAAPGPIVSGAEPASAPEEIALLATLARIHLIAEQPVEALAAADRAVATAPAGLPALVVRAMALTDSRRFAEAAQVAGDILRTWPEDAYAQRTGAALLSESRNGQEALNAAWNGVRVAPVEAEAHLVLAVVAARLRLFDLAQRAYAESLELDPAIGAAGQDVGIVRLERRRWARALEELAEEASLGAPPGPPSPGPVSELAGTSDQPARSNWSEPPAVSRPRKQVLDVSAASAGAVLETIRYGANGTLVAAVLTAAMTLISTGISRVWAGLIGVLVFLAVILWFRSRLSEPVGVVLGRLRSADRWLAAALYMTFAAPLFLVAYAVVGGLPAIIAGMVLAAIADLVVLLGRRH